MSTQPHVTSVNSLNAVPPGTVLQVQSTMPQVVHTTLVSQRAPVPTIINGATTLPRIQQQFLVAPAPLRLVSAAPISLVSGTRYRLTVNQAIVSTPAGPTAVPTHLATSNNTTAIRRPLQQPTLRSVVRTVGGSTATLGAPGSLANIRRLAIASNAAFIRANTVVATTSGYGSQTSADKTQRTESSSTAFATTSIDLDSSTEKAHPPTIVDIAQKSENSSSTLPVQDSTSSVHPPPLFPPSLMKSKLAPFLGSFPITDDASACLSHGLESFMKSVLAKLSLVASSRCERHAEDSRLVQIDNQREKLNFLQELDEHGQRKQSELEKDLIVRAAKSRSKNKDPDQLRNRELTHRIALEDYEREKQHQANLTALDAIGPQNKKKKVCKLEESTVLSSSGCHLLASQDVSASGMGGNPRLSIMTTKQLDMLNESRAGPVPMSCQNYAPMLGVSSSGNSTCATNQVTPAEVAATSCSSFNLASSSRVRRATLSDFQCSLMNDFRLRRSRTYCATYRRRLFTI